MLTTITEFHPKYNKNILKRSSAIQLYYTTNNPTNNTKHEINTRKSKPCDVLIYAKSAVTRR